MQQDSIFTKIIKREIPAHIIYEDDDTLAFLDINPKLAGHTLVISKKQVEFIWDLDDDDYTAVMTTVKKVALRLRQVMDRPYVHMSVVGTDVPHAHVHIVPFSDSAELHHDRGLADKPSDDELASIAEKLRF